MSTTHLRSTILTFMACASGSILLGLAVLGRRIFDPHLIYFQLVGAGLLGGLYAAATGSVRRRTLLAMIPILFAVVVLLNRSTTTALLLRDAVWVLGLLAAVVVALAASRHFPRMVLGKFVIWSAIFAAMHLVMVAILSVANAQPLVPEMVFTTMGLGALIGAGLGLGYEVAEALRSRVGRLSRVR